ncbi:MAG: glycosyltransferase family 39 protein, partial [Planctomycetes bacterium]|nr:glycosyltransferase family 39 protein [Planctomycetota bacterium]
MPAAPARPDRASPILVGATALFLAGLVAGAAQVPLWKKPIFVGRPSLLVAARNDALAGTLMMEDDKGVVLSTGTLRRIEEIDRPIGNRLSIWIFGEFYRRAGDDLERANRRAHFFGAGVMAAAVALFFLLAYRRLGYGRAVLAGLAWVTMPTYLAYLAPGHAEIPLFFLSVALLAVLGPEKPGAWHWLVAGVFTGLAAASKLTFAFYGPILFLWALATRAGWKSALAFVLPLPIAGLLYFGP